MNFIYYQVLFVVSHSGEECWMMVIGAHDDLSVPEYWTPKTSNDLDLGVL